MTDAYMPQAKTVEWETPQGLYDMLDAEFGFTLDVCATKDNFKHKNYFTPEQDALQQEWKGVCWMNPPYGRGLDKWMKKAYESSLEGATVVCLVQSSTDTNWWHNYSMKGEIRFIKGRVKFVIKGQADKPAPFSSAIVIFRNMKK